MFTPISIGGYKIPNRRLAKLFGQTEDIFNGIGEGDGDSTRIMSILSFEVKSPSYYQNRKDLETFGLVTGQGRKVRITPLGLQVIAKDETIKAAARKQVFDHFELWKKLRDRLEGSVEEGVFVKTLTEITGEVPDEKTALKIRKAYLSDLQASGQSEAKSKSQSETVLVFEAPSQPKSDITTPAEPKRVVGYITFPEYSESPIQIKDQLSYEIAQKLLKEMGRQLGIEKKQVQTSFEKLN